MNTFFSWLGSIWNSVATFLSNTPPPGLVWLTVIVAGSGLLWNISSFLLSAASKERARRADMRDDFWFRAIINPICLEPLLNFLIDTADELNKMNTENGGQQANTEIKEYDTFLDNFKNRKDRLISRFLITKVLDFLTYESITKDLDELDDAITTHCAYKSLGSAVLPDEQYSRHAVTDEKIYSTGARILDALIALREKRSRRAGNSWIPVFRQTHAGPPAGLSREEKAKT